MENNISKSVEAKPDILQIIPDDKLVNLRDLFKTDWPSHVHIHNFIDNGIKWKKDEKFKNYVQFYCPNGDWSDGTIVAILQMRCYDILVYSFDKNLTRLQEALKKTRIIDWGRKMMFPSTRMEFKEKLWKSKAEIAQPFMCDVPSFIWWLPKEKAMLYKWSVPDGYYVAPLKTCDAETLNEDWPHKHPGSEQYIATLIECNGGVGLYNKETNVLCAWVLKNYFGGLGILQVAKEHKRKGFGSLITKIFSKMLAEDGLDIIGCVVNTNIASQKMFTKLEFEQIIAVTWLLDFA